MVLLTVALTLAPWLAPPRLALADGMLTLALVAPLRIAPRMYYELLRPRLLLRRARGVVLVGRAELVGLELRRVRRQRSAAGPDRVAGLVLEGPSLDGARHAPAARARRAGPRRLLGRASSRDPDGAADLRQFSRTLGGLCRPHRVPFRPAASLLALGARAPARAAPRSRARRAATRRPWARRWPARRVLVTGAGGSIGRELALQLSRPAPQAGAGQPRRKLALPHRARARRRQRRSCDVAGQRPRRALRRRPCSGCSRATGPSSCSTPPRTSTCP